MSNFAANIATLDAEIQTRRAERRELIRFISGPEQKAAAKLGVSPTEVREAARSIWGQSLVDEREDRVCGILGREIGLPPGRLQAIRGHVTRGMLRELQAML